MRVVITGASGNVGTALLRALPAEHDIVGVVRRPPAKAGRLPAGRLARARPDRAGWASLICVGCSRVQTSSCTSRGGFSPRETPAI